MKLSFILSIFAASAVAIPAPLAAGDEPAPNNDPEVSSKVVFEVSQGGESLGELTLGLFNEIVPKTCENFYLLAKTQSYVGVPFHRVIKDFMIQGGNIGGNGGVSIYGSEVGSLPDENFELKHDRKGRLSMANAGPNTALSQFFITAKETSWLDGHHVVFGQLLDGFDVLDAIINTKTTKTDNVPVDPVVISAAKVFGKDGRVDTTFTEEELGYDYVAKAAKDNFEDVKEDLSAEKDKVQADRVADDGKADSSKDEAAKEAAAVKDELTKELEEAKDDKAAGSAGSAGSSADDGLEAGNVDGTKKGPSSETNPLGGSSPTYSAYYVVFAAVLFMALVIVITLRSKNKIMYAIRGPRYRRIQAHR